MKLPSVHGLAKHPLWLAAKAKFEPLGGGGVGKKKERKKVGADYLKAFSSVECPVGAVSAINGEVVGLECFSYHQTFEKFFQRLIQSYALDAIDSLEASEETRVPIDGVREFLETLGKVPEKSYPSLALGENVRLQDHSVSGATLVYEDRIFHLSAFTHTGHEEEGRRVSFQRFSQRSRRV